MILGHLGVAAMARGTQRNAGGTPALFAISAAAIAPDIVDFAYFLLEICSPVGLYSHTVPAIVLEAAVVGGLAYLITGSWRTTAAFTALVPLHLASDFFTMRKLVMPGGELVGLNLYDRPLFDFLLEAPLITLGWYALRRSGNGPRWAVSGWVLAVALLIQGSLNVHAHVTGEVIKPNSCYSAAVG